MASKDQCKHTPSACGIGKAPTGAASAIASKPGSRSARQKVNIIGGCEGNG